MHLVQQIAPCFASCPVILGVRAGHAAQRWGMMEQQGKTKSLPMESTPNEYTQLGLSSIPLCEQAQADTAAVHTQTQVLLSNTSWLLSWFQSTAQGVFP